MSDRTYILAIESSCDDTSAAVIANDEILSNIIASQEVHATYGGVVPELASRAHQQNIVPVVHAALQKANITLDQLKAIAFTKGPGLMGSLLVGSAFAKSLSLSLNIPLIGINHMQAHILAHFIKDASNKQPTFPFLCLTISGGHTQIVKVLDYFEMEIIGETIDDAVGEAYDKTAKILGLPYPGGPLIDKYAQLGEAKFTFTKPNVKEFNFSFSGLKTAILYFIQKEKLTNPNFVEENLNDICASVQHIITEILMDKLKKAVKSTQINQVAIAGGVSANSAIRKKLMDAEKHYHWKTYIPKFEYTTDNAGMIAISAYHKYRLNLLDDINIPSNARLKVTD